MRTAWTYGLELLVVIMINVCVIGFVGAWFRATGGNPYLKPAASVAVAAQTSASGPPTD